MNSKHEKIKREIFKNPIPATIKWDDIESLLINLGAILDEGSGSRVRFKLNGIRATFHRPHPEREASKATVKSVARFLNNAGIYDDEI